MHKAQKSIMFSPYHNLDSETLGSLSENVNQILEILKSMFQSLSKDARFMWSNVRGLWEKPNKSRIQWNLENQSDVLQASPIILESNKLEDALAIQIAFEDQRVNEVEKIDQREPLVISNKSSLISHIEFVIPNEFKDVKKMNWCKYRCFEFLSFNSLRFEVEFSPIGEEEYGLV